MSVPLCEANIEALVIFEFSSGRICHSNPIWNAAADFMVEHGMFSLIFNNSEIPVLTTGLTCNFGFICIDKLSFWDVISEKKILKSAITMVIHVQNSLNHFGKLSRKPCQSQLLLGKIFQHMPIGDTTKDCIIKPLVDAHWCATLEQFRFWVQPH